MIDQSRHPRTGLRGALPTWLTIPALPRTGRGRKLIAELEAGIWAYLDESGIHDDATICVIAGFVGSVREWSRFNQFWGSDATEPGFHAKEFFKRAPSGECLSSTYADWDARRAALFLDRLLWSIENVRITAIGAAVDVAAFRGYSEDERRALTGAIRVGGKWRLTGAPSRPYYVPFQWSILKVASLVQRSDWKAHFVFDQQKAFSGYALEMYRHITNDPENCDVTPQLGGAAFQSRFDAPPLQAADLVAHAWYQLLVKGRQGITKEMERAADVFTKKGDALSFFSKDVMDKLLDKIALAPGREFRV